MEDGRLQSMENQVCPKYKTGVPVTPEMFVRWSQIMDCNGCHQLKKIAATPQRAKVNIGLHNRPYKCLFGRITTIWHILFLNLTTCISYYRHDFCYSWKLCQSIQNTTMLIDHLYVLPCRTWPIPLRLTLFTDSWQIMSIHDILIDCCIVLIQPNNNNPYVIMRALRK